MQNPILQNLNTSQQVPMLSNIRNLSKTLRNFENPQQMLQSMFPQYNQVMKMVEDHGGDAKAAFYEVAKQKGVDPEQILQAINGQ